MCAAKLKPAPRRPAAAAPPVRASAPSPPPPREPVLEYRGTVPLSRLRPSPTNPRKTFNDDALFALAASMAAQGLLQPILVRPVGGKPRVGGKWWEGIDHFEVVAGERRFRAAKLNGWSEVPVTARVMTDEDVLTVQLVENDQREDVRPSERAAAYAALAAAGKRAEDIAAATGLPLSSVRDLVRLAKLPPWLLAAVDAGEVALTAAALVARVPDEKNRKEAAACVLLGAWDAEGLEPDDVAALDAGKPHADMNAGDGVLSFRETKDLLRSYQRELKGQPWRKALDLVPGAVACDECPKLAGNAAKDDEAFKEVRADTCLDPACYAAKTAAWAERVVAKAEKKGRTVIPAADAATLFHPDGRVRYGGPYLDPDARCWDDEHGRTFGDLLKGHAEPVVAVDPTGRARDLYPAEGAAAILKQHHGVKARVAGGSAAGGEDKAERAKRMAENKLRREFNREVLRRAADAAWQAFGTAGLRDDDPVVNTLLRQLADEAVGATWGSAIEDVADRRGIKGRTHELRDGLRQVVGGAGGPAVLALLVELHAAKHLPFGSWSDKPRKALAAALGLDRAGIEREVKAKVKAGKAKPVAPKPAPAAARATSAKRTAAPAAADDGDDDEPASAGRLLADLVELPAAAFDLLEGAGCLSVEQAWSAARQSADDETLARPPQDVFAHFLAELGGEGHLVNTAATVLTRAMRTPASEPIAPPRARCRVCGCTDDNCLNCIEKTGAWCSWVEPDLCSACVTAPATEPDVDTALRGCFPVPPLTGGVRWAEGVAAMQAGGATDAELLDRVRMAFGIGGRGTSPGGVPYTWSAGKNSADPGFWFGTDRYQSPPTLSGKALLIAVRRLFGVPHPGAAPPPERTAPIDNEHVVGAKAEQRRLIHTPTPKPKKVTP